MERNLLTKYKEIGLRKKYKILHGVKVFALYLFKISMNCVY